MTANNNEEAIAKAFKSAEGSAAHEFGDGYVPGEAYQERRRKIISGEMTFEEAEAELLAPYKKAAR